MMNDKSSAIRLPTYGTSALDLSYNWKAPCCQSAISKLTFPAAKYAFFNGAMAE